MKEKTKISTIVQAKADELVGLGTRGLKKKYGIGKKDLSVRIEAMNQILTSDSPNLSVERQIISEAISDRLKPIKEELAVKSLEIVRMADEEVVERLKTPELLKEKDLISISDTYSKRLSRLTGIEEDPGAGEDTDKRVKNVNVFVQNIFAEHSKNLEKKRNSINNVYDVGITPESTVNKGENEA